MIAFLVTAILVWIMAHRDGNFIVLGLEQPLASDLGPLLPAVSAGLAVAMALSLADAAAGTVAGLLAALVVLLLPGFMPLHRISLVGPPLTALTLMVFGVMLQAPRFSIAHGVLAAVAGVFVDPTGIGLIVAAMAWAVLVRRPEGNGTLSRIVLTLVPLAVAIALTPLLGSGWNGQVVPGWRGSLDHGLQAAGSVIGDQLAPSLHSPAVRWFAIADLTLIGIAVVAVAWRRSHSSPASTSLSERFLPAALTLMAGYAIGLGVIWLFVPATSLPRLESVFPLIAVGAVALVGAVAMLWRGWPRWGKVAAIVVLLGWVQAALRG